MFIYAQLFLGNFFEISTYVLYHSISSLIREQEISLSCELPIILCPRKEQCVSRKRNSCTAGTDLPIATNLFYTRTHKTSGYYQEPRMVIERRRKKKASSNSLFHSAPVLCFRTRNLRSPFRLFACKKIGEQKWQNRRETSLPLRERKYSITRNSPKNREASIISLFACSARNRVAINNFHQLHGNLYRDKGTVKINRKNA